MRTNFSVLTIVCAAIVLNCSGTITVAQTPVAIVEEVQGAPPGVDFMDYLDKGKVISLGTSGSLLLGYLKSCQRESINGGTVTVGIEQSEVVGGRVERNKIACEASKMQLSAELAAQSGAMVFRDIARSNGQQRQQAKPQFTLYGLSPIVEMRSKDKVVIERVDQPGEKYEIDGNQSLIRGAYYDFAVAQQTLTAGGVYRASSGNLGVLFRIDPSAQPGATPIAGRLLRLPLKR
jgi:hypothetical protein